jgi:GTP-binding protein EngB required for normal cell division
MPDDLAGLLERADLALGSCAGVIEEAELAPLIEAVRAVRTRASYPDDLLVVALAGGTGSGKSSLLNAIAEEDLVDVGGVRPTTSRPAAAVPSGSGSSVDGYLDRLGISERHVYEGAGLCLIDLPDTDSVHVEHRHRVDGLLPLVDVIVWVTDPEKYRDARLHDDYLKPMAEYSSQFVFVVNQVDRLAGSEVADVCHDLESALEEDWLEEFLVIPTAAAPPSGPPIGIDDLRRALDDKRQDHRTLYGKLLTDLAETSRALSSETGTGLDFDTRAGEAVDRASEQLAAGDGRAATETLIRFLDALVDEAGGLTSAKLEVIAAEVPDHLRRIEGELPAAPTGRRVWLRRRRNRARPTTLDRVATARALVSEAVVRPARATLARRALAVAAIAEFALEVENLRHDVRR